MKTIVKSVAVSFLVIMLACNSEKKKEVTTATVKEQPAISPAEPKKTEISIGADGAEVKTKKGTEVKVGQNGAAVDTKDVKIAVKKKDEKQ